MPANIAIIGGGISGLSTAHYLLRRATQHGIKLGNVYLLEGRDKFGGWLQTKPLKNQDAYFELGPRTINLASKAGINAIALAHELGLDDRIHSINRTLEAFRNRYVAIDGELKSIAFRPLNLFTSSPPFKPLLSYILKDWRTKPLKLGENEDISVDRFFRHRFGDDIAEYMVSAICHGISGGDSTQLSMRGMFPNVFEKEKNYGSVIKGMLKEKEDIYAEHRDNPLVQRSIKENWGVFTFKGGIQTLPDTLAENLATNYADNVRLCPSTKVVAIDSIRSKAVKIQTSNNETLQVDHIFSTVLASDLANMLPAADERLKSLLTAIPSIHMGVVSFAFDRSLLPPNYGFGFLVPSNQKSNILGITFDSCILPHSGLTIVTVMLGGHSFLDLFGPPDQVEHDHLLEVSRQALIDYLNIDCPPLETNVSVHTNCIPQYIVGHPQRVEAIDQLVAGSKLSLCGTSFKGFSVPDVIANAKVEVDKWLDTQLKKTSEQKAEVGAW